MVKKFNLQILFLTILPIQVFACIISQNNDLTPAIRNKIAACINWYYPTQSCFPATLFTTNDTKSKLILIDADNISLAQSGHAKLSGNVSIRQGDRIITTKNASIFRNPKNNAITDLKLTNGIRYQENNKLMYARKMHFNPHKKSGKIWNVIYRFDNPNSRSQKQAKHAWGQAGLVQRDSAGNYYLSDATYTACAPQNDSWHIAAKQINIYKKQKKGVAKHAKFYLGKLPVFYMPFWNFPTTNERKSGFLFPTKGYSNAYGFDIALPYYLNLAPNYDATIIPHFYAERGVMIGGEMRYLSANGLAKFYGNFLPNDPAYRQFLASNLDQYPDLLNTSTNRWSLGTTDTENFGEHLKLNVNYQQVSDAYYLQNFTNNLAMVTQRQLPQQGDLTYTDDHWLISGMLQRYQTLQPINETPILDIYQRLPQVSATGVYADLPFNSDFKIIGQYDQFILPNSLTSKPQGPRFYLNPILATKLSNSYSYFKPSIEWSQSYYSVNKNITTNERDYNEGIPRYAIDSGLYFDKFVRIFQHDYAQTLEPRLYYLYVPYRNQTEVPVYDSAYMIFDIDQLTRNNRFSGFDRIGDANQLALTLSSRFIDNITGNERLNLSIGQLYYFTDRQVFLCQSITGSCVQDPLALGYLSPSASTSPIASRAIYTINNHWLINADYMWNTATRSTNNAHVDLRFQQAENRLLNLGYTYMVNGDITVLKNNPLMQDAPLHQAYIAYAWPYNDHWSSLGAYSYDVSQNYQMMGFLGLQYDNCCWAVRLLGGETFTSLDNNLQPEYNKSVFLQIIWKGLGNIGVNNPQSMIKSFLPDYQDPFH